MNKKQKLIKPIVTVVDEDMSEEAMNFYKEYYPELEKKISEGYMRGETMCSLGWTFGSLNKGVGSFEVHHRSYTQFYSEEDIELFYKFRNRYHSLVNFCVWPADLNYWRGYYDGKNQGDYPDIFLDLVRKWYIKPKELPQKVFYKFIKHRNYFDSFGKGSQGWKNYINANYFRAFCNNNYEVKDLFSPTIKFVKEDAPIIGIYHSYGEEYVLPGSTKNPRQTSLNYIENSLYVWDVRAEELLDSDVS